MKKLIKLLLGVFVFITLFELITFALKKTHDVKYQVKADDKIFNIHEIYKDKNYYFKISNGSYKYAFELPNKYSKSKKVINKIYTYKAKDALCIYPALKDTNSMIMCSKDNETFSYEIYKNSLKDFVKKLKEKGYDSNSWLEEDNTRKKIDNVTVYTNNISSDTYMLIYKYDGFYSISKDTRKKIELFKEDVYNNKLGFISDKYYIVPNYDQKHDYNEFYIINMVNNKVKTKTYKIKVSSDSYINGTIDNETYIFDKDSLKQYKIFKNGKKIKEVGNKEDGVLYYDLDFKTVNAYTLKEKEEVFKTIEDYISKIESETTINFIRKNNESYYYQTKDNDVYYYNLNSSQKVLLFNKKISDFILIEDTIYFISEDSLYSYNIFEGMKKLLTYSELGFNTKNRLAIYKR